MKGKAIAVGVLLIILVVFGLYWYQTWNGPLLHTSYNIGDEIKGFPVSEMSFTVCNMTISQTTDIPNVGSFFGGLPAQSNYVILTVAIKNLENTTLYFDRASDFGDRYSQALQNYDFVLTYGQENHEAYPETGYLNTNGMASGVVNLNWGWGINMMNAQDVTSLGPFQTVYGYLIFFVGEYYSSNQLLCREGSNSNPNFVVNLKT
jgi:hypothetical protein